MSIIADALKKVEENSAGNLREGKKPEIKAFPDNAIPSLAKPKKSFLSILRLLLFLILLLSAGAWYWQKQSMVGAPPSKASMPSPRPKQILAKPEKNIKPEAPAALSPVENKSLAIEIPKEAVNPELVLNGIMYSKDKPIAVINNALRKEGEMIEDNVKVAKIKPSSVDIETETGLITLRLKQ